MIKNKFMKFAPKEHNDKKVKKTLEKHNVPTFEGHEPAKFGQFGQIAKDVTARNKSNVITPEGGKVAAADKTFSWQQKSIYGGGIGATPSQANSRNPYAVSQPKGNPYAANNPYAGDNPYLAQPPAEEFRPAPLRRTQTNQSTMSSAAARKELFGEAPTRTDELTEEFDELNQTSAEVEAHPELYKPREDPFDLRQKERLRINNPTPSSRQAPQGSQGFQGSENPQFGEFDELNNGYEPDNQYDELNAADIDPVDELNALPSQFVREEPNYQTEQQLFEDSEDEDVEFVKREIRQTKQESVESTRRALQIAAETETSGRNTLGMLGDQGERLGNSAKTVQLGNVQSRVADENADELRRLNRSIFIPNVSNPFNSRRRAQMKEQKLKSQKAYDEMEQQYLAEQQRESAQRVNSGLNQSGTGYSDQTLRIQQRMNRDNPERKMYQFEADSEDEELEDELEQNLEGISDAAKRLKGLSLKINEEVGSQNTRVETMGDRVDDLDHKLHKTTAKMSTII